VRGSNLRPVVARIDNLQLLDEFLGQFCSSALWRMNPWITLTRKRRRH